MTSIFPKSRLLRPEDLRNDIIRRVRLERKLCRQLDPARPATTQERITNTDVSGRAKCKASRPDFTVAIYTESLLRWIRNEKRQERTGKVRVIQKIEELRS